MNRLEELTELIDETESKLYKLTDDNEIWHLIGQLIKWNVEKSQWTKNCS